MRLYTALLTISAVFGLVAAFISAPLLLWLSVVVMALPITTESLKQSHANMIAAMETAFKRFDAIQTEINNRGTK